MADNWWEAAPVVQPKGRRGRGSMGADRSAQIKREAARAENPEMFAAPVVKPTSRDRAAAAARREMVERDRREAELARRRAEGGPSPAERIGLAVPKAPTTVEGIGRERDRSMALIEGYAFGLGDEIMGLRSGIKTGVLNALGQPQGYSAREAYDARSQAERDRLAAYTREHPVESGVNTVVGAVGNPLNFVAGEFIGPIRAAGSVPRATVAGGAMGAAYGAGSAQPGQRVTGAVKGGAIGAATSGTLQLGANALAARAVNRAALPPSPQRQISRQGVELTPGQMIGGGAQRLEDAFVSVPIAGDAIRNAQRRGIESFDRAAMNRVLEPISGAGDDVGRAGIRDTSQQVSSAYQRALDGVTVSPDVQLADDLARVEATPNLPPAIRDDLGAFLGDVRARLSGPIDGPTWKALDADLGAAIRSADAGSASQPSQRFLRDALIKLRQSVGGMMERTAPTNYAAVRDADEAAAMLARVREAGQYQGTAAREGLFTAGDLNRAVRGMDTSAGNRAYAQGNALLQDLTDPAMQVLPQTVPDSGTALRSAFTSSPQGLIVGGITGIPASVLYSRPVQSVLNSIYRASDGAQAAVGLQQLSQLAAREPALVPAYLELRARLAAADGGLDAAPEQLEAQRTR